MSGFWYRFWNASPRSVVAGFKRRWSGWSQRDSGRPRWRTVRAGPLAGRRLWLDLLPEPPWKEEMIAGSFDDFIYDKLRVGVDLRGAVLWDVGAHFGYHTLAFAALAGEGGRVVAFEPNPANRELLQKNASGNPDLAGRLMVVPAAVTDREGERGFMLNRAVQTGMSSVGFLEHVEPAEGYRNHRDFTRITSPCIRLDGFHHQHPELTPKAIKIDVEGAEYEVLVGSRACLQATKPVLFVEIHNVTAMFKVVDTLKDLGYRVELVNLSNRTPSRGFLAAC